MKINSIAIDKLIPYHNNPRKDQAVDKVASSINEYGFQQPIVVDKNMVVVVGHTRLMGAKKLGLKGFHSHKTDTGKTLYMAGPNHEAFMKRHEEILKEKESDSSLWENIRKKRERIKSGSGEKMRKKGDKGAPTPEQIKKAKN